MCEAVPDPRIARIRPRRLAMAWPSCGCLSRVALRLRTVPSEQRRSALSHHGLSHTLTPLSAIKRHDLQQFDRVPRSPRCLIRAYLIGANGCLPRPLGTTQPSRNCDHLLARPDLGDVQAGPQPLDHANQAATARGGMSKPWMSAESRAVAAMHATVTRTAAHRNNTEPPRGGPTGGGRLPSPATPNLPPQPSHTLLAGQSSRREGGGRGDSRVAPGLANGSGTSLFQPRAVGPPHAYRCWPPIIQAIAEQCRRAHRPWAGAPGGLLHWIKGVWVRRPVERGGVIGNP